MKKLGFIGMTLAFKIRDLLIPRKKVLDEVGIQAGHHVLDFGCGPGSYIQGALERVGESGVIYALDISPLAVERIRELAAGKTLHNIRTILSDCDTGLEEASIDVVLLYDVFHHLREPEKVLKELGRILKKEGFLSFSDHHMKEEEILTGVTGGGLFKLLNKGKKTYTFKKTK